ncbi:hypothetical protein HJFPF1_07918 [Paramyrothecium foliicola]|nr:hypothetical protein HJFPF1_07918 [Paramyrothecium foliicola]
MRGNVTSLFSEMSDSEDKAVPSPAVDELHEKQNGEATTTEPESQLEVARRFLDDDEVKSAPHEKKAEFLRSKGIEESDIDTLLQEVQTSNNTPTTTASSEISSQNNAKRETTSPPGDESASRPPIVTYPEFLAKPTRPPPLVTTNRLLHTLNAFGALSAVLYGASKFVVGPMVENLTAARVELHGTASSKLDDLVTKLEQTVSEIPPSRKPVDAALLADSASDIDDPAEMFHRDVGTQTSLPSSPPPPTAREASASAAQHQVDRLVSLARSLSALKDDYRTQSEELEDIKTLVDVFRDDLDTMTYGGQTDFVGGYDVYSRQRRNEPEDEIKRVRDNIRRVKGVLLSTRNFPASTWR